MEGLQNGERGPRQGTLLGELEDVFGYQRGSPMQRINGSYPERLIESESPVSEVRQRYEAGCKEGRYPALSVFLRGASCEQLDQFFGGALACIRRIPPKEGRTDPWNYPPWYGDTEAYREDLYAGMAFGLPDVRAFAREWLEELLRVGYYGMEESLGLSLKQRAGEYSAPPRPLPLYGEAYPIRLGDTRQTVWIQLDGPRSSGRGYREIFVSDEPLRTDAAILAALTALEVRPLNLGLLREVLPSILPLRGESFWDRWTRIMQDRHTDPKLRAKLKELRHHQTLDYVLMLLRYHRPDFDDLCPELRADLVAETCGHANELMEVLRKIVSFLEHGKPNRRGPAATRIATRDVRAAVLKDVDGFTYRRIGDELCIPLPADFLIKGDHPTVRKMVGRGRRLLEKALGEEGWRKQAEAMRNETAQWQSLDDTQRETQDFEG